MQMPKIGISIGSTNDKDSEMIMRVLKDRDIMNQCRPLLIGPQNIFIEINNSLALGLEFSVFHSLEFVWPDSNNIIILDDNKGHPLKVKADKESKITNDVGIATLDVGLNLAFQFKIDALVVAPMDFDSMYVAGFHYDTLRQILSEWTRIVEVEEVRVGQAVYYKNLPTVVTSLIGDREINNHNDNHFKEAIRLAIELAEKKHER